MVRNMLTSVLALLIFLACFGPNTATTSWCKGTVEECLAGGRELGMMWMEESETAKRRLLGEEKRYISYGALQRNTVPCSRKGASYYNCMPGAEANPYTRGCSAITHCRSS